MGRQAAPTADVADPLAVGVTDNNPQTLVPGYVQLIQNYHGRVGATDTPSHNPNYRGNFAVSYVTGAHSFKTGIDLNGATRWADTGSVVPYSYVVSTLANNGVGLGIPVADHPHAALGRLHRSAASVRSTAASSAGTRRFRPDCPTPRQEQGHAARAASSCRTDGRSTG